MADLDWIIRLLPQGSAVSAVVAVVAMILLQYVPRLIKEFREIITEERELFRGEMKELRTSFSDGLKEVTQTFTERDTVLSGRIDGLRDEVHGLKDRLEK